MLKLNTADSWFHHASKPTPSTSSMCKRCFSTSTTSFNSKSSAPLRATKRCGVCDAVMSLSRHEQHIYVDTLFLCSPVQGLHVDAFRIDVSADTKQTTAHAQLSCASSQRQGCSSGATTRADVSARTDQTLQQIQMIQVHIFGVDVSTELDQITAHVDVDVPITSSMIQQSATASPVVNFAC